MKLAYNIIPNLINLKPIEMDLFLYICRYADDEGVLRGIDYRDFMQKNGSKSSSFYDAKKSLQEKDLIYILDNSCDYQTIVVKGNDAAAWSKGYVNLNRSVFRNKKFKELLPKEKWLVLEYFKNTASSKNNKAHISVESFYKKYIELMNVTEKTIRKYLKDITWFFDVYKNKGIFWFTYIKKKLDIASTKPYPIDKYTEDDYTYIHIVQTLMKKHKIKYANEKDIYDTAYLFKQYKSYRESLQTNTFTAWVDSAIKDSVYKQKDKTLNPKYVHKLLKEKLETFCIA